MKKLILWSFALLLSLNMMADEPLWTKYGKALTVKGGPGIEQFVEAILETKKSEWNGPGEAVYDKPNGFFHFSEEGSGHVEYYISYWNRKDGKKLVMFSYESTDFSPVVTPKSSAWGYYHTWPHEEHPGEGFTTDTGFRAYLYDAAKNQLVPLQTPPFNGWVDVHKRHFLLQLPRKGKDITVREDLQQYEPLYHTLKWNGTTFDFVEGNGRFDMLCGADAVYDAPNGKKVQTLSRKGIYSVGVDRVEKGWAHLVANSVYEYESDNDLTNRVITLKGSANGYWVPSKSLGGRGYGAGGVTLREKPDDNSKVVFDTEEDTSVSLLDIKGVWIKVKVDKTGEEGWIRGGLCTNPYTNCC